MTRDKVIRNLAKPVSVVTLGEKEILVFAKHWSKGKFTAAESLGGKLHLPFRKVSGHWSQIP